MNPRGTDENLRPPGRRARQSPGIYYVPNLVPVLAQLNVLWLLWDKALRQCLHDKTAKTIVVTG
jgi:hypothetical protein